MPKLVAEYEAEIVPGIEPIALRELTSERFRGVSDACVIRPGFARFKYRGDNRRLAQLRSVAAVYQAHRFDIPRPKALLGHQHFTRLAKLTRSAIAGFGFERPSLGIGAAGADSSVFRRLKRELAAELSLPIAENDKGELYLRIVRSQDKRAWEVLARLTAQPLSKRSWRVVDKPGALNATVAYAMGQLSQGRAGAGALNLCCGTATIAIEQALSGQLGLQMALDNDTEMLAAARRNVAASGLSDRVKLMRADATRLPLVDGSVEQIYADLPFGHHIGSHAENREFYPKVMREAARVAAEDATFVLLTHDISLMRSTLVRSEWRCQSELAINLSGLHPRVFVLRRKSNRIKT